MLNRILIYFGNEECSECLIKYGKMLKEKFDVNIEGVYIKDIRKYEMIPPAMEGMVVDSSASMLLKEWEALEEKLALSIAEKFKKEFGNNNFSVREGIAIEELMDKFQGYDLLVLHKKEKIGQNLRQILREHYKPIIVIPSLGEYSFENIVFANDNHEKANKSIFSFMNLFPEKKDIKIVSVNKKEKDNELREYLSKSGYNVEFNDETGIAFEVIQSYAQKSDLLIMGDLKYHFMIEKIVGKTGVHLLEDIKKPIFIG